MDSGTSGDTSVQLTSTLNKTQIESSVKQNFDEIDPRFRCYCADAVPERPDKSNRVIRVLRDTGALQSLVCSQVVTEDDYKPTGECRLIRGVTGDVISVPLIEVSLQSSLCSGTFLCGLVSTLPTGIGMLVGNDLCPDPSICLADVNVVTRSQTAALCKQAESIHDEKENSSVTALDSQSDVTTNHTDDPMSDLSQLFNDTTKTSTSFDCVDRKELIKLQKSDPDLESLFTLIDKLDHNYTL